ncbi:hypothetical protein ACIBEH_20610 [Nocardia salmonicida]|uniref:hypothetical protein n=1 Tax=Nocardia salmonicida TaxID=53431 RepID=UPI0037A7F959
MYSTAAFLPVVTPAWVAGPFEGLNKPILIGAPAALTPGAMAVVLPPASELLSSLHEATENTHAAATAAAAIRRELLAILNAFPGRLSWRTAPVNPSISCSTPDRLFGDSGDPTATCDLGH